MTAYALTKLILAAIVVFWNARALIDILQSDHVKTSSKLVTTLITIGAVMFCFWCLFYT